MIFWKKKIDKKKDKKVEKEKPKRFKFWRSEEQKLIDEAQAEFDKGNIGMLTDKRDFENYEELKEKTSHLKQFNQKLVEVHEQ